jgi:hypothetical protein
LTRFAIIRAIGPRVKKWRIGDIVAVSYVAGTELYAPAVGFRHDGHKICTENNVLFKIKDKKKRVSCLRRVFEWLRRVFKIVDKE